MIDTSEYRNGRPPAGFVLTCELCPLPPRGATYGRTADLAQHVNKRHGRDDWRRLGTEWEL